MRKLLETKFCRRNLKIDKIATRTKRLKYTKVDDFAQGLTPEVRCRRFVSRKGG